VGKGKPEIDRELCKGCGLCVSACPEQILRQGDQFNSQGQHFAVCVEVDACTACMACAIICPDCAIEIWRYAQVR
jgi:2-oxoglutarate ferredoxin oxidoreductase subunit delta